MTQFILNTIVRTVKNATYKAPTAEPAFYRVAVAHVETVLVK